MLIDFCFGDFMKIFFILALISHSALGQVHIVSDLDDTIKITNVLDRSQATRNGLFSLKAFEGVPKVIQEMRSYVDSFTVVSASPKQLTTRIRKLLRRHNIIPDQLFTRNFFRDGDTVEYKTKVLEEILSQKKGHIILFGDDTEHDPDIFLDIQTRFPGRILAVYIHAIRNIELPKGFQKYFTGMEIARGEVRAERMNLIEAYSVMNSIQIAGPELVFPDFAYCPKKLEDFGAIELTHMEYSLEQTYYPLIEYCFSK